MNKFKLTMMQTFEDLFFWDFAPKRNLCWAEVFDREFYLPDGFTVGEDQTGIKHLYDEEGYYYNIHTDTDNDRPYIEIFPAGDRIYLKSVI